MKYIEQLNTEQWKQKKSEILKRDNNECQVCMSKQSLQVHHKQYIDGLMAWEYEDKFLITLCKKHHLLYEVDKGTSINENQCKVYDNPFIESLIINSTLTSKGIYLERDHVTKIYVKATNRKAIAELSPKATKLFLWILYIVKFGNDKIKIDLKIYMKECAVLSDKTIRNAITELINKNIIAKTKTKGLYYINPSYFFCGSRINQFPDKIVVYQKNE